MINKNTIYKALGDKYSPLLAKRELKAKESDYVNAQFKEFEQLACEYLQNEPKRLSFKIFMQYWKSGDREQFQSLYYDRRGRLLVFSVLAAHCEKSEYVDALEDIIWEICSEPFWCLPAHFTDANDKALPFEKYATALDLFSCETGFALCEATALCEGLLHKNIVEMVKQQLEKRIFTPFLCTEEHYRFEGMQNNWSAVCAGAIGGAAIYEIKDNARLASILHRCISAIDVYLSSFGCDGICTEGVDYWNYGFGFFTVFADLVKTRTNGIINLFKPTLVQKIASAGAYYYLGKASTISFSDGSENGAYRPGLFSYISREYSVPLNLPTQAAANILKDKCYRYCTAIRDIYWYDENMFLQDSKDVNIFFEAAQWFVSISNGNAIAAKAGNNKESHNHNDCGSFIFVKNGVQLLADFGAGLYDRDYFGERRYEYLVNRSCSHNVALINSKEQCAGAQYACKNTRYLKNGIYTELTSCYNEDTLTCYSREIVFENSQIALSDIFNFSNKGVITEVFASHTPITIEKNTAVFEREGEKAIMTYSDEFHASLCSQQYKSHNSTLKTAYFLHLTPKEFSKNIIFKAYIK